MRKLKLFGGLTCLANKPQSRTIVAASSQRRAVELLQLAGDNMSLYYFHEYFMYTSNEQEIRISGGMKNEGIWICPGRTLVSGDCPDKEWRRLL